MRWLPLALAAGLALVAAPGARAADGLAAPTALTLNTAFSENAAAFGVENGEQNTTAPFNQQCDSGHNVGVARTGWYTIQGTGDQLTATTAGSDFDTALFVYSGSPAGEPRGCHDDDGGGGPPHVPVRAAPGATHFPPAAA